MAWAWAVGSLAAAGAWFWLLRPYQKGSCIMMFLDPESDALGAGWNIIQSKIAIGSGVWTGNGLGAGFAVDRTSFPNRPPTSRSRY